ncbi:MAG: hypothetical protein ABIH71_02020 [Candidatus Omnitrophota bacterium]
MWYLILAIIVVVMYVRTLNYGYCIDDFDVAKSSVNKESPKSFWVRAYLSWQGICYKNPRLGHTITFILHLTNSLLVYYAFGQTWIAFLTALLFAIHPAGTQGSVWMSGKGYSTATLFTLLMYAFPLAGGLFHYFAFTYGGFSATFAPLIFIATPFWWMIIAIPILWMIKRKRINTALSAKWEITPELTKKVSFIRLILYFKTLGYYTWLAIFPMKLGAYHTYLYTYGLSKEETKGWHKPDLCALLGVITFSLFVYCLIFYRLNPITLGLAWYVILISQWCNFPVTLQQAIGERYLSLPLIGAMYALVNAVYLIPEPITRTIILTAFITFYAIRLNLHIPSYRNVYFQIDHNLINFPDCYAVFTWKGQEEKNRGAFFTALEAWFQGWKMRKIDFRLNNNISVLLAQVGQLDQALDFLKIAEANIPKDQMEEGMAHINNQRNIIMSIKNKQNLKNNIILPRGRR